MRRLADPRAALAWISAAAVAAALGCSHPETRVLQVGHHRVRLEPPPAWESLDHGRTQLFRSGENLILLEDLGPGTRAGLVREIARAREIWLEGRRADAFARVRELRGPPLALATRDQVTAFWRPWWDMMALFVRADSAAVGAAFDSLIGGVEGLAPDTPENRLQYVLRGALDPRRYEVARQEPRTVHSSTWIDLETWDRVTHLDRRRLALLENGGYLLVLRVERGRPEAAGPAFERLLASIEVLPVNPRRG